MDNKRTRLYLLRHGETENYDGEFVFSGHVDLDVTKNGEEQLALQAERLKGKPIKRVYASDLQRSYKGAKAIAAPLSVDVVQDARFKEICSGRWDGLTYSQVAERYPEECELRYKDLVNFRIKEGGENLLDAKMRAMAALSDIVNKHPGEEIALVAHGGINRVILSETLGLDLNNILRLEQDFGCLNIIEFYDSTALVRLINLKPSF
ncbi:MAG: histidine phosphatase family protein [Proteobacteria bacterium]|nr:histidine phosphatase family protein [Pseudomonadota bacterium]